MINEVYQLIAPKLIDTAYKEIDLSKNEVILRPVKMSICKADQRYYQGLRNRAVLMKKLPMALIHECVAEVIYDPSGEFSVGEMLIPIPNTPTETDPVIAENYLRSSHFCSSGYDGFMRDYIQMPHDRLVKVPEGYDMRVASFSDGVETSISGRRITENGRVIKNENTLCIPIAWRENSYFAWSKDACSEKFYVPFEEVEISEITPQGTAAAERRKTENGSMMIDFKAGASYEIKGLGAQLKR